MPVLVLRHDSAVIHFNCSVLAPGELISQIRRPYNKMEEAVLITVFLSSMLNILDPGIYKGGVQCLLIVYTIHDVHGSFSFSFVVFIQ